MDEELAGQYRDARLYAWLTAIFGGSALLLVTIGIYGVTSSMVSRRLPELGVRIAVGARPRDVITLVVGGATRPVLLGVGLGAIGALAGARLVESLVYGVAPTSPAVYLSVAGGVLLLASLAAWLPARRATRMGARELLNA
jgi:putative ABC transport system permease protein